MKILDEVYRSCDWFSQENFAFDGVDLSSSPAYGSYDVIPASSPLSVINNYDYLIFVGHNTMSKELYQKLVSYVKGGGHLLACAAHMNTDSTRTNIKNILTAVIFQSCFALKSLEKIDIITALSFIPTATLKT